MELPIGDSEKKIHMLSMNNFVTCLGLVELCAMKYSNRLMQCDAWIVQ